MSVSPFLTETSSSTDTLFNLAKKAKERGGDGDKSKLTMVEAAVLEWAMIDRAARTVLPSKPPYIKNLSGSGTEFWRGSY